MDRVIGPTGPVDFVPLTQHELNEWQGLRICRDLDCPNCGYPELGQTFGNNPALIYCRKCSHGAKVALP